MNLVLIAIIVVYLMILLYLSVFSHREIKRYHNNIKQAFLDKYCLHESDTKIMFAPVTLNLTLADKLNGILSKTVMYVETTVHNGKEWEEHKNIYIVSEYTYYYTFEMES